MTSPAKHALSCYGIVVLAFILSRLAFYWVGVTFLYQLPYAMDTSLQFIDPEELHRNLWQSLLYLHTQPPILNFLLGASLKFFGEHWGVAVQLLFLAAGLAMNLALLRIMLLMQVRSAIALAAVLTYMVSPAQILYENYFSYPYLTAFLITLSVWCALECTASSRPGWAYGLSYSFMLLCLLRSLYHVALFALPFWLIRKTLGTRVAVKIIAIPFMLVVLWYAKNMMMFGFFGSSSWLWMNLNNIIVQSINKEQRAELERLSGDKLTMIPAFSDPKEYGDVALGEKPAGPPVYTQPYRSTGAINYNYHAYLELSKRYKDIDMLALQQYPSSYAFGVARALITMCAPAHRYYYFPQNMRAIQGYADWYDLLIWWSPYKYTQIPAQRPAGGPKTYMVVPGLAVLLLLPIGLMVCWKRCVEQCYWRNSKTAFAGLVFITILITYAVTLSSLLEVGENHRFRFDWEPLFVILIVSALSWSLRIQPLKEKI